MFQLCFNINKIHDVVEKALRTADQDRVTTNSSLFLNHADKIWAVPFVNISMPVETWYPTRDENTRRHPKISVLFK